MITTQIDIPKLIKSYNKTGHVLFEEDSKNFNLNIIGVRSQNPITNQFNCKLIDLWKYEGCWNIFQMQATTLPGLKWMESPMNPDGCAILKEGQYRSTYKISNHNGKYEALCQRLNDVDVFRDNDRDREYDMIKGTLQSGMFGINIHKAHENYELETVNGYSAGCQVVQDPQDYLVHMTLVRQARINWGNSFTYTLINETDLN